MLANVQYQQNLDDPGRITNIRPAKDIYEVIEEGLTLHQPRKVAYTGKPLATSSKAAWS